VESLEKRNGRKHRAVCGASDSSRPATSILCLALLTATLFAFTLAALETSWALLTGAFRQIKGF
jgi:hypothetical protein